MGISQNVYFTTPFRPSNIFTPIQSHPSEIINYWCNFQGLNDINFGIITWSFFITNYLLSIVVITRFLFLNPNMASSSGSPLSCSDRDLSILIYNTAAVGREVSRYYYYNFILSRRNSMSEWVVYRNEVTHAPPYAQC